jgi:hypothetical protein
MSFPLGGWVRDVMSRAAARRDRLSLAATMHFRGAARAAGTLRQPFGNQDATYFRDNPGRKISF